MNAEMVKTVAEAALMVDEAARKLLEADVRIQSAHRALVHIFPAAQVAALHAQLDIIVRDLYEVSKRVERSVAPVAALIPKENE